MFMRDEKKRKGYKMNRVEVQYFNGCPNSSEMIVRVKQALIEINIAVEYIETLVETNEKAMEVKFRGSPTLLVNGVDFEGLPEPEHPALACRNYQNGLPSAKQIVEFIKNNLGE